MEFSGDVTITASDEALELLSAESNFAPSKVVVSFGWSDVDQINIGDVICIGDGLPFKVSKITSSSIEGWTVKK